MIMNRKNESKSNPAPEMEAREILYGRRPLVEALRAGRRQFFALWVAEGARGAIVEEARREAARRGVPIQTCRKSQLDRWTHSGHHQGVALEVSSYPYADMEDLWKGAAAAGEPPFLLFLDHLEDPQNVGSLLRTAEAAGVHGVIVPRDRAAPISPAVARASSGATEHLLIAQAPNLVRAIEEWKQRGLWIFGLDMDADLPLLTETRLDGPVGLVVGHEGEGLGRLVARTCDARVRIPMRGRIGSLNAAVSGAIALYEVRRQRDLRAKATPATAADAREKG